MRADQIRSSKGLPCLALSTFRELHESELQSLSAWCNSPGWSQRSGSNNIWGYQTGPIIYTRCYLTHFSPVNYTYLSMSMTYTIAPPWHIRRQNSGKNSSGSADSYTGVVGMAMMFKREPYDTARRQTPFWTRRGPTLPLFVLTKVNYHSMNVSPSHPKGLLTHAKLCSETK